MNTPGVLLLLAFAPGVAQPAFGPPPGARQQEAANDPWQRGRAMIDAGDVEGGLLFWIDVRDSLTAAGNHDPRIGTQFVEAVAEHGLGRFTEAATEMFYWGLSGRGPFADEIRDEILEEGRRTFTLTDSVVADYWIEAGREDPESLAIAIKTYWIERDPTPTTPVNERLVEHWQRIAHARRTYGEFIERAEREGINSAERRSAGISDEDWARVDRQPQYEIWRYAKPYERDFYYYLFGNVEGVGRFQLVEGLHRLLPSNARVYKHNDVRFQYYLERFYYVDLARIGGPYGQRLAELERLWGGSRAPSEGFLEAASQQFIEDDRWLAREPRPSTASEIDDAPRSALSAQAARILADAEPRILLLAVSSPLWRPRIESGSLGDSLVLAPFVARHTVVIRDRGMNEMARAGMVPVDGQDDISTVVLRHPDAIGHLSVTAEHKVEEEGADEDDSDIGVLPGQRHFRVGSPLRRSETEFEVSDLIVGLAPRPELSLEGVPVPLLPATRFWRNDLMRVYFEIYRPSTAPEGETGHFDVRISIQRLLGPVLPGQPIEGRAVVTVTLESPAPDGEHFFGLDLRNERPGDLRLVLEITDKATGATRVRVTPISLLAN